MHGRFFQNGVIKMNEEETINKIVDNNSPGTNQSKVDTEQLTERKDVQKPKRYKKYDFKARVVSKELEKNMLMLHNQFARKLGQYLSSQLWMLTEVECSAVDQMAYADYLMSLSEPSCLCVFSMEPLQGSIVMEISPSLVLPIIEKLQGGEGNPIVKTRALSKFEEFGLEHSLINGILNTLQGAWENVVEDTKIKLERIEQQPQHIHVVSSTDTVMVVMLQVNFGQVSGLMSLCYPTIMIEPVRNMDFEQSFFDKKVVRKDGISNSRVAKKHLADMRSAIVQMQSDIANIKSTLKSLVNQGVSRNE